VRECRRQREFRHARHAKEIADESAKQAAENKSGEDFGDSNAGVVEKLVELPGMDEFAGDHRQRRHDKARNA